MCLSRMREPNGFRLRLTDMSNYTLVTLVGPVVGVPDLTECVYPFPTPEAAVRFARAHGMPNRPAFVDGVIYTQQPDAPWLIFLLSRQGITS